jgi:hypothetical protein
LSIIARDILDSALDHQASVIGNQERQQMFVRAVAVAAAVAVWCVCGVAVAAGQATYKETWNPPEASGHLVRHAKKTAEASGHPARHVKKAAEASGHPVRRVRKTAEESGHPARHVRKTAEASKKHVAHGNADKQTVASASNKRVKPVHGKVQKVAAKGAVKGTVKHTASASGRTEQSKFAHHAHADTAELARSGTGSVHPHVVKTAANHESARLTRSAAAVSHAPDHAATDAAAPSTTTGAAPAGNADADPAVANPAIANSGSMPPILK